MSSALQLHPNIDNMQRSSPHANSSSDKGRTTRNLAGGGFRDLGSCVSKPKPGSQNPKP